MSSSEKGMAKMMDPRPGRLAAFEAQERRFRRARERSVREMREGEA